MTTDPKNVKQTGESNVKEIAPRCNDATVAAEVHFQGITRIGFFRIVDDVREAAIVLRELVGQISPLNDSLLGRTPTCTEMLELDLERHRDVRKFMDVTSMVAFQEYLKELAAGQSADMKPYVGLYRELGFTYATVARRAFVSFLKVDGESWRVGGYADFRDPTIACRNLRRMSFDVKGYQM